MATQEAVNQSKEYKEEYICTIYRMLLPHKSVIYRTDWFRINFKKIPRISIVPRSDLNQEILAELERGKEFML